MKLRAVCEYDKEVKAWSVVCPELPGLTSCGDTEEQSLANFHEAVELYFIPDYDAIPAEAKVVEMVI
jgi:predicted RNase H-like HicB family nuclease